MGQQVVTGAVTACSFGLAPGVLNALPVARTTAGTPVTAAATVMDHLPVVNVTPFGMCASPTNPAVAAATAAAFGVLTPMPCMPVTPAPWIPGSPNVLLGSLPALNNESVCACTWGGVITIVEPGQVTVEIP